MFIYFSDILGKDVLDSNNQWVGKVYDLTLRLDQIYPKISGMVIYKRFFKHLYFLTTFDMVEYVDDSVRLKLKGSDIAFSSIFHVPDLSLKRDILDQQVVDTFNYKVIRVNDIHLLRVGNEFLLAHVDVGIRGLVRRLGLEKTVDRVVRRISPKSLYLNREDFIGWKYVQPLSIQEASKTLRLNVEKRQLLSIPTADMGEIMMDLDLGERLALLRSVDLPTRARVFEALDFDSQEQLLGDLSTRESVDILNSMSPDEATDLLDNLPARIVKDLLTLMESGRAKKLSTLLGYSSDSAGGLMTTEFLAVREKATVKEVLDNIRSRTSQVETINHIYIVDANNKLISSTTLKALISANPEDPILKTALPKTAHVHLSSNLKEVAYLMEKYKYIALPVLDRDKVIHGIVTIDDILSQVLAIAWRKRTRHKI
jgi:magnesium transporter